VRVAGEQAAGERERQLVDALAAARAVGRVRMLNNRQWS
jgi:hypothetical protein